MAPIVSELRDSPIFEPIVVVSGQHREMLDQVNNLFGITPDRDLDIFAPGQSLTDVTTRSLAGVGAVIRELRPDAMIVQGDTTTTFAGALGAFYEQVPVIHVEAGLRTSERYSPFPEEINRRLTTQLTNLHLAPSAQNRANLLHDGVPADQIAVTGNTVIDALLSVAAMRMPYTDPEVDRLVESGRPIVLVTTHRRESWGEPMRETMAAINRVARSHPEVAVVLPMHRNPVVREVVESELGGSENVLLTEPMAYGEFARLMADCSVVVTDSGGLQEEAPSLGKPVLVMRENTERPEAVDAGTIRLVGTDGKQVERGLTELLTDPDAYAAMATAVNPFGDGRAANRSVAAMAALFGAAPRLPDFTP